jgi:hypothetical protein
MSSIVSTVLLGSSEGTQLLVDLVAADLGEVVALRVEVEVLQQVAAGLDGRRLTRAQLAVDVESASSWCTDGVLLQGQLHRLVLPNRSAISSSVKPRALSSTVTGCLRLRSIADVDDVLLVDLELEPGARGSG